MRRTTVAHLAVSYALVMATSYVLKAVRNALFLERQGVGQLPFVALAVAAAGAVAGIGYGHLSSRVRVDRLVRGSIVAFVACLVAFRLGLAGGGAWMVYGFYVWVALFGLVATSLVWLLANAALDAREARRSFGTIGTAGIVGAVLGGLGTRFAVGAVGAEGLLLVSIALLAPCGWLLGRVPLSPAAPARRAAAPAGTGLSALARSELLAGVAVVTLVGSAVSVIVDIQFNEAVARAIPDQDAKTAFFGTFLAALSAAAFVVQLVVTRRVLEARGVGVALLLLPAALAVGSAAMWIVPGLWAAMAAKGGDGALRHSVHKSASEIVLVPVPEDLKRRAKLALDATVGTLGEGLGAVIVLVVTGALGLPHRALSFVSIALVSLWLLASRRVRRAYVEAFRGALERRAIDPGALRTDLGDATIQEQVAAHLGSEHDRHVVYALDLLAGARDPALAHRVAPLVEHASPEVRKRALRVLVSLDAEIPEDLRERLLRDADPDVRLETMRLEAPANRADPARLDALLAHPEARVQAAALDFVARDGTPAELARVDDRLLSALLARDDEHGPLLRAMAARVLGALDRPAMLRGLTTDRGAAVVTEVIRSAGQTRDPELCAWLLERLGDGRTRREARAALAAYGTGVLEELGRRLADVATPRAIRVQLPRVVAEIGGLPAAELLLARLGDLQPALHLATIKALNRLRVADPTLRFPVDAVERHVLRICGELGALHAQRAALPDVPGDRKVALLGRAVAEKCASLREQALRLLGLCYPPRDMLNAFHGLVGEDRARRAHALEFLDNVLSPRIRAALVPVLEGAPSAARPESPRRLLESADAWLRACAVANVRVLAPDEVATWVERARADRDPIVRDAAGGA